MLIAVDHRAHVFPLPQVTVERQCRRGLPPADRDPQPEVRHFRLGHTLGLWPHSLSPNFLSSPLRLIWERSR
jgi:hypothetical protein